MPTPALKSMAFLSCTYQPVARRRSSIRSRAVCSGFWLTSRGMGLALWTCLNGRIGQFRRWLAQALVVGVIRSPTAAQPALRRVRAAASWFGGMFGDSLSLVASRLDITVLASRPAVPRPCVVADRRGIGQTDTPRPCGIPEVPTCTLGLPGIGERPSTCLAVLARSCLSLIHWTCSSAQARCPQSMVPPNPQQGPVLQADPYACTHSHSLGGRPANSTSSLLCLRRPKGRQSSA